jgi:hypothetical protein
MACQAKIFLAGEINFSLPNLHVRRSVTFYIIFRYKVYIGFLSRMRDWTVAVAQYSKFAC